MVNIYTIDAETRLSQDQCRPDFRVGGAHHPGPLSIPQILFIGTPDALRLVQAEQAIIKLTYDILRGKKIIKHPLFSECGYISTEDRCGVWSERSWLVNCDENVFQLE